MDQRKGISKAEGRRVLPPGTFGAAETAVGKLRASQPRTIKKWGMQGSMDYYYVTGQYSSYLSMM